MMTDDEIIRKANEAYHARHLEEAQAWISLLHAVQYSEKRIAERVEEARARVAERIADPHQQDHDEYIEEMSLGGPIYTTKVQQ